MTFEVGVSGTFHATHALRGDFGPAREPHAHDYRVDVAVRGDVLREDGTLCDIVALRELLASVTNSTSSARPAAGRGAGSAYQRHLTDHPAG